MEGDYSLRRVIKVITGAELPNEPGRSSTKKSAFSLATACGERSLPPFAGCAREVFLPLADQTLGACNPARSFRPIEGVKSRERRFQQGGNGTARGRRAASIQRPET